jgi:hypothetical protein
MAKTLGLSPKVRNSVITMVIAWILARYNVKLDPDLAAAIAIGLGGGAGVASKPGDVVIPPTRAELAQVEADAAAGRVPAGPAPSPPPVMPMSPPEPPPATM